MEKGGLEEQFMKMEMEEASRMAAEREEMAQELLDKSDAKPEPFVRC